MSIHDVYLEATDRNMGALYYRSCITFHREGTRHLIYSTLLLAPKLSNDSYSLPKALLLYSEMFRDHSWLENNAIAIEITSQNIVVRAVVYADCFTSTDTSESFLLILLPHKNTLEHREEYSPIKLYSTCSVS